MDTRLKGRDFITFMDYSSEELELILSLASDLKRKLYSGEPHPLLTGKTLGMLFCSPSLRTRVAFETAMTQLGGHSQYYSPDTLHLVRQGNLAESWKDTASVLSRFVDGLMVRLFTIAGYRELEYTEARSIMNTLAEYSSVPVISGVDDIEHPTQVLADLLTFREKFGQNLTKKKIALIWVPSPTDIPPGIPHSLVIAGAKLGLQMTFAHPEGFELDPDYLSQAKTMAARSGASIEITNDMMAGVKDADVIYAKGWGAIGKKHEDYAKARPSLEHWRITGKHIKSAAPTCHFMHAMPIARDVDATNEVIDGSHSIIYDQAENRLHVVKALMSLIM